MDIHEGDRVRLKPLTVADVYGGSIHEGSVCVVELNGMQVSVNYNEIVEVIPAPRPLAIGD